MTAQEVGDRLEWSTAKVSRMETGQVALLPRDVAELLDLYGVVDAEQREELLVATRESRQKSWWNAYRDVLSSQHRVFIGLETDAVSLRTFEPLYVPGLLQTEDYAGAVIRAALRNASVEDIERLVAVRMARQALVTRSEDPLRIWAVLDEGCLRRQVGSPAVMRDQLLRLVTEARRPNVVVQVLPFSSGAHPGMRGSLALLEFAEPADPDVVYVDSHGGELYLERPEEVRRCGSIFDHLRAAAAAPDHSIEILTSIAGQFVGT